MNYSKNLRKMAMTKRVIISWVIVATVGLLIGSVSGYALKTHITAKHENEVTEGTSIQSDMKFMVYGEYGDCHFNEEIPIDWERGDLDFTPLEIPLDKDVQEFTYYLCVGYNLDFSFVMALMQHESNYQADIVSSTNDYGLMQINRCNHEELTQILGVTDYLDPYENIRAGCFTLRKLFEKYKDTNMVLMAYNMGETGASRLWEQGIYDTEYTDGILMIQQQFSKELEGDTNAGKLENN